MTTAFFIGSALATVAVIGALLWATAVRRVPVGRVLMVTGGREPTLSFSKRFVLPFVRQCHLLDLRQMTFSVDVAGANACISSDGVSYELSGTAHVRLSPAVAHIIDAARHLGIERLGDPDAVARLLQPSLINAIKSGLEAFTFEQIQHDYGAMRRAVLVALAQITDYTDDSDNCVGLERFGFIIENVTLASARRIGETGSVAHMVDEQLDPLSDDAIPEQIFHLLKNTLPSIPTTERTPTPSEDLPNDPYEWRSISYQEQYEGAEPVIGPGQRLAAAVGRMSRLWPPLLAGSGVLLGVAISYWRIRFDVVGYGLLAAIVVLAPVTAAVLTAVVGRIAGASLASGAVVGVGGLLFWNWTWDIPIPPASPILWMTASLVIGLGLYRFANSTPLMAPVVSGLALTCAVAVLTFTAWAVAGVPPPDLAADETPLQLAFADDNAPDVYLLLTSGLMRSDVIEAGFPADVDRIDGASRLENLGLVADHTGTANFAEYGLAAAAIVNGRVGVVPGRPVADTDRYTARRTLGGSNQLVGWFKSQGYEYWHAPSRHYPLTACDPDAVDRCFTKRPTLWSGRRLLAETPFGYLADFGSEGTDPANGDSATLTAVEFAYWATSTRGETSSGSAPRLAIGFLDGPDVGSSCPVPLKDDQGWTDAARDAYADHAACALDDISAAVEHLRSLDPAAIVIVVSVTGPRFSVDLGAPVSAWTVADVWERFGVLQAWYLPSSCIEDLASLGPSPGAGWSAAVNLMPRLQRCLTSTDPAPAESRLMLAGDGDGPATQVTNAVQGVLPVACTPGYVGDCIKIH